MYGINFSKFEFYAKEDKKLYTEISLEDLTIIMDIFKRCYENHSIRYKALEYIEHLMKHAIYHLNKNHIKKLTKILEGKTI